MYAILRAVPNKLGGVVALFSAILVLAVMPFIGWRKHAIGCIWSLGMRVMFWLLVGTFLLLTWLGRCPAEEPFNSAARVARLMYFFLFLAFPV